MPSIASNALVAGAVIRLKQTRHGFMLYCVHDDCIGRSLDLYGEFSPEESAAFGQLLKPGMFVLDVGANIGVHTLCFAKAVAPAGEVLAFEPQGFLHQILCCNLLLNEVVNVHAMRVAVGRQRGEAWIPSVDYATSGNFGGVSLQDSGGAERVGVVSIDSLDLARCDFIKIDVEGMEEDVIVGATATIKKHRPVLYVENDRRDKSASLIATIFSLGYSCYWHMPSYFAPDNAYSNPVNVFGGMVSVNMICLPSGRDTGMRGLERITDPARHPIDTFKKDT